MPEIRVEKLKKSINKKVLIDDVSLEIPDRSLYCILGPTGSGKTILMRILAGLEIPDEGKVFFDGKDVTMLEPDKRGVSIVFQNFALYPHLTAFENIASPLRAKKVPTDEVRKRVEEVAEFLKIGHRLTHYPDKLSGGEQQRVAIARALVKDSDVILLDQPLSRLDYKIREEMRGELYRIQKHFGKNIILIGSDPLDAMSLADIIAFIDMGKIIQVGTREELYEKPANVLIGRYFGVVEMNILEPEEIIFNEGSTVLQFKSFKFELPISLSGVTGKIKIGIRPEHINLRELSGPSKVNFKGKVILTEIVGSETIFHLDIGLSEPLKVHLPVIFRKEIGSEVMVGIDSASIYIFSHEGLFISRGRE
ncbi:MAG: ABC transporter ATP-binding protein [Nitrososphaerota archaeon]